MASVRYMVNNVSEAMEFYCERLGFAIERDMHPNFASVRLDDLSLWLAGPGSSAGRPTPDGAKPEAGGWNRLVIHVDDIEALVQRLKDAGASFRNEIVRGPGGAQILIQDPSGDRRRAVSAGAIVHLWSLQVDHGGAVANKSALDRVREICLALPEATEKPFGGHTDPTWRVPDKIFAMYSDNHHGDGRVSQCKAPPGAQEVLTGADPQRFFIPPYVGHIAGSVYDSTSGRSIGMSSQPSSMTATG